VDVHRRLHVSLSNQFLLNGKGGDANDSFSSTDIDD